MRIFRPPALLAALLLAGCAGRSASPPRATSVASPLQLLPEPTTAAGSPSAANRAPKDVRVAYVSDALGANDYGLNALAVQGLRAETTRLTLAEPRIISSSDASQYAVNLEKASGQASLVVAFGAGMADAVRKAAAAHPAVSFAVLDTPQDVPGTPNVAWISFDLPQGAYLAGIVAGSASRSHTIGFVGGKDSPEARTLSDAFAAGARRIDPQVRVLQRFSGSDTDQNAGKRVAQDVIKNGADVTFGGAFEEGLGVIAAAAQSRTMTIGIGRDEYDVAPNAVITSAVKRTDVAVRLALDTFVSGKPLVGKHRLGVPEDAVSLAPAREGASRLPRSLPAALEQARADFASGSVHLSAG